VLHCGGLKDALEGGQVHRREDAKEGESYLEFKGYNKKNSWLRLTPCDQDFVRKLARDTDSDRLEGWYGVSVARYLRDIGAYDPDGVFMVDGSYLFVPDNEHYEHSRVARFDRHNHPISKEEERALSLAEQKRCQWRRYYQMVSLTHTNRDKDFLLYAGAKVLREGGEVGQLLPLVERFRQGMGAGVMKTLLIDRGFIDGPSIGTIKQCHNIDVVVPLKAGMQITEEAWKLAEIDGKPWQSWKPPPKEPKPEPPQRPERIRRAERKRQETIAQRKKDAGVEPPVRLERVELKAIPRISIWDTCPVPLDVVLMREHMTDGTKSEWGLMTTREVEDPVEIRELYKLRPACEEGWRQSKCYWDMTGFRSPHFGLVVNQVVFVLLAYTLLQIFLLQSDRGELAKRTRRKLLAQLLPAGEKAAVYWKNYVGYFAMAEYSEILLSLSEGPRRRLLGTMRRLRKSQLEPPELPRRPT
jgi:hypothetical protein